MAVRERVFKAHPQFLDPLVSHLSFDDDILVFFDGSKFYVAGILSVLRTFQGVSGLALNLKKSFLFLDGNNVALSRTMARSYGLDQGSLPVKYLGLPLMPHKFRPQDYQPLIDKVKARIFSWTLRHLSFAGRLQLIQSVLFSIINFWASVFPLPKRVFRRFGEYLQCFLIEWCFVFS